MDRYIVGSILRPHGVRGAVKVNPLTDDASRFKKLKKVYIKNEVYTIQKVQVSNQDVYLTFNEIQDRDSAEKLRNLEIEIDKEDAIKLPKDRYFIVDLIGSTIYISDEKFGTLREILQYGSADVYVIDTLDKKEVMVPALKKLITLIDVENKKICLDKKVFEEVSVYED